MHRSATVPSLLIGLLLALLLALGSTPVVAETTGPVEVGLATGELTVHGAIVENGTTRVSLGNAPGPLDREATVGLDPQAGARITLSPGFTVERVEAGALVTGEGTRVLVLAPGGQLTGPPGQAELRANATDRLVVRSSDPGARLDQVLEPALLAGRLGLAIDATGATTSVQTYAPMDHADLVAQATEDRLVQATVTPQDSSTRLVLVALPATGLWATGPQVALDGEPVAWHASPEALAATPQEHPTAAVLDQGAVAYLLVDLAAPGTVQLTVEPATLEHAPKGRVLAYAGVGLVGLVALVWLGRQT